MKCVVLRILLLLLLINRTVSKSGVFTALERKIVDFRSRAKRAVQESPSLFALRGKSGILVVYLESLSSDEHNLCKDSRRLRVFPGSGRKYVLAIGNSGSLSAISDEVRKSLGCVSSYEVVNMLAKLALEYSWRMSHSCPFFSVLTLSCSDSGVEMHSVSPLGFVRKPVECNGISCIAIGKDEEKFYKCCSNHIQCLNELVSSRSQVQVSTNPTEPTTSTTSTPDSSLSQSFLSSWIRSSLPSLSRIKEWRDLCNDDEEIQDETKLQLLRNDIHQMIPLCEKLLSEVYDVHIDSEEQLHAVSTKWKLRCMVYDDHSFYS